MHLCLLQFFKGIHQNVCVVNAVIKIRSDSDFLLLSFSLMGSLSSFNCIRHYILHHHLMQYSELFCVSVVQGSSPREMKMYSSASLLMGKDFSRSLLLIGNASLTQGSKA